MATLAQRADTAMAHIKGYERVETLDFGDFHKATVFFNDGTGTRAASQKGATAKQAEVAALEHVVDEYYSCHACGRVLE